MKLGIGASSATQRHHPAEPRDQGDHAEEGDQRAHQAEHLLHHVEGPVAGLALRLLQGVVELRGSRRSCRSSRLACCMSISCTRLAGRFLQRLLVDVAHCLQQRASCQHRELNRYQPDYQSNAVRPPAGFYCAHYRIHHQLADICADGGDEAEDNREHAQSNCITAMRFPHQLERLRHARDRRSRRLAPGGHPLSYILRLLPRLRRSGAATVATVILAHKLWSARWSHIVHNL